MTQSPKKIPTKPTAQLDVTYPAGMSDQRSQPEGIGREKPGPKNPPEAAIVEDDGSEDETSKVKGR